MELNIKVCNLNYGDYSTMSIEDISDDFLPEISTEPVMNRFKKSEVCTINVLKYNTGESEIISCYSITDIDNIDTFKIEKDGWYTIYHIVLPSKEWFVNTLPGGTFYSYDTIYYVDSNKIIKYKDGEYTEVSVEELIERNPLNTTISKISLNYFSICNLMSCYIKISESLLSMNLKCKSNAPSELTFKRDVVWMTINIIKYLVDFCDYEGATNRLNNLNTCNGFCNDIKLYSNECNCRS